MKFLLFNFLSAVFFVIFFVFPVSVSTRFLYCVLLVALKVCLRLRCRSYVVRLRFLPVISIVLPEIRTFFMFWLSNNLVAAWVVLGMLTVRSSAAASIINKPVSFRIKDLFLFTNPRLLIYIYAFSMTDVTFPVNIEKQILYLSVKS